VSTGELDRVARSAGVVGGATLVSRILGLLRDIVLANVFARGATDAFFIAFMIPNLFRRLIGEGSLTVAFVPVFTGALQRSRGEARSVFNATWTLAAIVALGITLAGIAFAEPLVRLFAPGFALEPGKLELCAELLRWCFPYIFFLTIVAVAMGALNAVGHFLMPALAPVLLNLALILAALGFTGWVDPPILILGGAVVLAGALQVGIQIPVLRRNQLAPAPRLAPGDPDLRRLLWLMLPAVLGASVYQLNLLVVRFLSSFLGDGAVSYLYYADRLMELPLGVFIFALGMASLPSFSRLAKRGDRAELRLAFAGTLRLGVALALPSTVGLIVLREPIFRALFSWNAALFDDVAVAACAHALLFYALGLVPVTVARICAQLCIAHENTRSPAQAAVVGLLANALFALALIPRLPADVLPGAFGDALRELQALLQFADLGFAGLALATSLAALANAFFLSVVANGRYGRLLTAVDVGEFAKISAASAGMGAAVWAVQTGLGVPVGKLPGLAMLAFLVAAGAAVYVLLLALLSSSELRTLVGLLRRR
jgi:putative peptidoglycan lipid II flippase